MNMQCSNNYNIVKFLNKQLLKENLNCVAYSTVHLGRQVKSYQFMRCIYKGVFTLRAHSMLIQFGLMRIDLRSH